MTRVFPFLKAAIPTLLLAVVAPSATGLKADTSAKSPSQTSATAYSVLVARPASGAKPAIETVPKSQLAWNFSTLPDGTKVISGPNGTIWRGRLEVGMGPANPPSASHSNPNFRLYITPNAPGQKPFYEVVPPSGQSTPKMPNLAPILPPGQLRHYILPKITP